MGRHEMDAHCAISTLCHSGRDRSVGWNDLGLGQERGMADPRRFLGQ